MYDSLTTARLILRPWQSGDGQALYRYASDPQVGPPAGWPPHENLKASLAVLDRFIRQGFDWALTDRETGRILGSLGLSPDPRRAEGALSLG
ncbi:MAG: GNAT family N-acetyltransferase, partial [Christensenellaceae bacterium]